MRLKFPHFFFLSLSLLALGDAHALTFGDPNNDTKVDVADAIVILQVAVDLTDPTPDQQKAADVAPVVDGVFGDGKVDVTDATRLLRFAVGLETSATFPGTRYYNDTPGPTGLVPLPLISTATLSADTTRDVTLPGGFRLQGAVTGQDEEAFPSLFIYDEATRTYVETGIDENGQYLVGVPAGNYKVFYKQSIDANDPSGFSSTEMTTALDLTIPVNADTTQNLTAPADPQLFKVQGSFTPTVANSFSSTLTFEQTLDASGGVIPPGTETFASVTPTPGATGNTYSISLSPGTYIATIESQSFDPSNPSNLQRVEAPAAETFVVTGDKTQDLTPVPVFTLSGAAAFAGGPLPANSSSVSAESTNTSAASRGNFGSSQVQGGQYSISLPGDTYDLETNFSESSGENTFTSWNYVAGTVALTANTTRNIVVPALPTARITVQGTVKGPGGAAVTKGGVSFVSSSLTGADPGLRFAVNGSLSATGQYSVSIPPGEYTVITLPDPGFPVANRFVQF